MVERKVAEKNEEGRRNSCHAVSLYLLACTQSSIAYLNSTPTRRRSGAYTLFHEPLIICSLSKYLAARFTRNLKLSSYPLLANLAVTRYVSAWSEW